MFCKVDVRLRNSTEEGCRGFGKGIVMLLAGVEKYGSINRATHDMGMAYSKAWRIINNTEKEFGVKLVERNGARGSTITPEARKLMRCYNEMLAAAKAVAEKRMLELLGPGFKV